MCNSGHSAVDIGTNGCFGTKSDSHLENLSSFSRLIHIYASLSHYENQPIQLN